MQKTPDFPTISPIKSILIGLKLDFLGTHNSANILYLYRTDQAGLIFGLKFQLSSNSRSFRILNISADFLFFTLINFIWCENVH